jgi:Nucleotide-diphospho-sugar transferase
MSPISTLDTDGYAWPAPIKAALVEDLKDFCFDEAALLRHARRLRREYFIVSFLSKEYLPVGSLWLRLAARAALTNFAIGVVDVESGAFLRSRDIPYFGIQLPPRLSKIEKLANPGGFNARAMALILIRYRVIHWLLDNGISSILCDIDALLPHDPEPHVSGSDVAFQRVVFFPAVAVQKWGFALCAGFVSCRSSAAVKTLLQRVLDMQAQVSSDQLAWNLALLADGVTWPVNDHSFGPAHDGFLRDADLDLDARTSSTHLNLRALRPTMCWRHSFVSRSPSAYVIHPNSPKQAKDKMTALQAALTNA